MTDQMCWHTEEEIKVHGDMTISQNLGARMRTKLQILQWILSILRHCSKYNSFFWNLVTPLPQNKKFPKRWDRITHIVLGWGKKWKNAREKQLWKNGVGALSHPSVAEGRPGPLGRRDLKKDTEQDDLPNRLLVIGFQIMQQSCIWPSVPLPLQVIQFNNMNWRGRKLCTRNTRVSE